MPFRSLRGTALATAMAFAVSSPLAASAQQAEYRFDIPVQDLGDALRLFAQASKQQITFDTAVVDGKRAAPLAGHYTVDDGLRRLLAGTRLEPRRTQNGVLYIVDPAAATQHPSPSGEDRPRDGGADAAREQDPHAAHQPASGDAITFDEVIVTAQKRESTLLETPVSLSVLGASQLERRSLVSADDYLSTVPGVHLSSFGLGENQLVIRGLGLSSLQTPTAGAYLGDVPLTDAIEPSMTDLKLVDMERVEVLRGPQGTLYGSGSLGGAVRNIPVAPALDHWEAKAKLGYSVVDGAGAPGHSLTGVFNAPLREGVAALRVAVYRFKKPGFVDEIGTPAMEALSQTMRLPISHDRDAGGHTYNGARASALLQVSDRTSATLMAGYQHLDQDGRSEVIMDTGRYVGSVLDTGEEFVEQAFRYANLLVEHDLGWGTLTSSSSWTRTDNDSSLSHTRVIPSASNFLVDKNKKGVFQEFRVATDLPGPLQFVGGGYYEKITFSNEVDLMWVSPNLDALRGYWGGSDPHVLQNFSNSELTQLAVFGELSYRLAEAWTLRAGGRWFDYDRNDKSVTLLGVAPGVERRRVDTGDLPAKEDGQVYKLGIDYKPREHALIYAVASQGFRLGKTVDSSAVFHAFQNVCDKNGDGIVDGTAYPWGPRATLLSDSLDNFELGGKFAFLGGRVALSAAAYRIHWKDLPVSVSPTVDGLRCDATFNGGRARSQGLEMDALVRVTRNLQIDVSGSFTDAEYVDNLAGLRGQRLPFSPRYNANVGMQYGFDLAGRPAYVRGDLSYVGEAGTSFMPPNVVSTDAYYKLGLRAGVSLDRVNIEIFGTNLTNDDALVGVSTLNRGWRMDPRMVGVELSLSY